MNIRKQELTEIGKVSIISYNLILCADVYHRILRFKNYIVAMVNKEALSYKIWIPFYGEK